MKKQIKVISLLLIIFFVSLSFVSATDSDGSMLTDDGVTSDNGYYTLNSTGNDGTGVNTPIISSNGNQNNPIEESNSKTFSDLRNTINSADEGSTIILYDDYTYDSGSTFEGIGIKKQITIDGNGHTLDGQNSARMLYIDADNVVLKNINFVNGNPVNNNGVLQSGGALLIRSSNTLIENCAFTNNKGRYGGAIFMNEEYNSKLVVSTTILGSEFSDNTAEKGGGAIYSESKENLIQNNRFTNNKATGGLGGAVFISGPDNEILNNVFTSNTAQQNDGGALSINVAENQLVANNTFTKNYGKNGGAVNLYYAGGYTVINNIFDENSAELGGAMRLSITSTASENKIANNIFKNNNAKNYGGAISSDSDNTQYTQNTFTNNIVESGPGGAINLNGKSNEISDNVIEECSASTLGGAIYMKGDSNTISNNYISDCRAVKGGAINFEGAGVTINNNNIKRNVATVGGGAIFINGVMATIKNNIISDNSAVDPKSTTNINGGALYVNTDSAVISGNTFTSNSAGYRGGAIINYGKYTTISSNMFKGNTANDRGHAIASTGASCQINKNVFIDGKNSDSTIWWYNNEPSLKDNVFTGDGGTYTPISTAIYASDVVAYYNSDGIITAVLKDAYGTTICDTNVEISVGDISEFLTTDKFGEVFLSTNGLSPGIYTAVISYVGNDIYASSSKSINVKINRYLSSIDVVYDNGAKELIVGLVDNVTGSALKGATVVVNIGGANYNVKITSTGQGRLSVADLASGTYIATAFYAGNAVYAPASADLEFTVVNKAMVDISAVFDSNNKELIVTLVDPVTGSALKGAGVIVNINGENYTVKITASGEGRLSLADLDYGTYTATAYYKGNANYYAATASTIVVVKDDVNLSAYYAISSKELVVSLVNSTSGSALKGATVVVNIDGRNYTVKIASSGQGRVALDDLDYGAYTATLSYKGNAKYYPASETLEVVIKDEISLTGEYDYSTKELVVALTDYYTGAPLKGATVNVNIDDETYSVKINSKGEGRLSLADLDYGTYTAALSYKGNAKYYPATVEVDVVVKDAVNLSANYAGSSKELIVTLVDAVTGSALKGATVRVNIGGNDYSVKIASSGQGRMPLDNLDYGTYAVTLSYKGNAKYAPATVNQDIIVKDGVNLYADYDSNTKELVVTLIDATSGAPLKGASVSVTINGETYSVKINSKGEGRISLADFDYGTYAVTLAYKGNAQHVPATVNMDVIVKDAVDLSAVYNSVTDELVVSLVNATSGAPLKGASVSVNINNVKYSVKITSTGQGKLSLVDLAPGTYSAAVSYKGNAQYNSSSTTVNIVKN